MKPQCPECREVMSLETRTHKTTGLLGVARGKFYICYKCRIHFPQGNTVISKNTVRRGLP